MRFELLRGVGGNHRPATESFTEIMSKLKGAGV